MPPPRIQRSRQAPTIPPLLSSHPPPYPIGYPPTVNPLARFPTGARTSSVLTNYRYKRRDTPDSTESTTQVMSDTIPEATYEPDSDQTFANGYLVRTVVGDDAETTTVSVTTP